MDVFGLGLRIKEEGAATVEASLKRLAAEMAKTVVAVGTVTAGLHKLVEETTNAQYAEAQLEAVLKSTGNVAGQSAYALKQQASALQGMTTYGDDAILKMQALLLTFTQVRGAVFTEAVPAILNMATVMGTDLNSAAIQVGKALNDPIKGISAMARAGVQFSEAQQATIKSLVESGQKADAQRIILKELETQFGGAAEAARNTFGGALKALDNAFGDLFEVSREGTTAAVAVINKMTDSLTSLNENFDKVKSTAIIVAGILAGMYGSSMVTAVTAYASAVSASAMAHAAAAGAAGVHSAALTVLIGVASAAAGAMGRLVAAMGPVGLLAVGVGLIIAKITELSDETIAIYDEIDRREQAQLDALLAKKREREQAEKDRKAAAIQAAKDAVQAYRDNIKNSIALLQQQSAELRSKTKIAELERQIRAELQQTGTTLARQLELRQQLQTLAGFEGERIDLLIAYNKELPVSQRNIVALADAERQLKNELDNQLISLTRRMAILKQLKELSEMTRPDRAAADVVFEGRFSSKSSTYVAASLAEEAKRVADATATSLSTISVPMDEALLRMMRLDNLANTFAGNIENGVGAGIRNGLQAALQTGDIGNFTKALAQSLTQSMSAAITDYIIGGLTEIWKRAGKWLIKGLMDMAADFAQKSIVFATFLEKIKAFLSFGNGIGAIIAATALLAFAHANGGKSTMGGNVVSGGAGGLNMGMTSGTGSNASLPVQQIIFGATSATTAAGMTPRSATNVTIIGPNDPSAQRAMQELLSKANSRGGLG